MGLGIVKVSGIDVLPFVKSHGLGNDYLVLDARDLTFELAPAGVRRLCDRHRGVGADGVLLAVDSAVADFGVRIFNPDGSEAEKSGNGLRIFARFVREHGRTEADVFTVETRGGVVRCACRPRDGRAWEVRVEMGRATFEAGRIPMRGVDGEAVDVPLAVDSRRVRVTAVSVGNPHCVLFTDRLDEAALRHLGPRLERHPAFPERTNVQLARVEARDRLAVLVWERGAGPTSASGSSACAVSAAAVRTGRCDPGRISVGMPGGVLEVDVRPDGSLRLAGPVEEICTGTLSAELVAGLRPLTRAARRRRGRGRLPARPRRA